jgi:hypothetical protein
MTTGFMEGLKAGLKDGPRLFFALLTGAIKGICAETQRVLASEDRAHVAEKQASDHRTPPGR